MENKRTLRRTTPKVSNSSRKLTKNILYPTYYWKVKLSDKETDRLKLIDETYRLENEDKAGIQRSNIGGWHSHNFLHHNRVFDGLFNAIFNIIDNNIIKKDYKILNEMFRNQNNQWQAGKLETEGGWVNINRNDNLNMEHAHDGNWLSAAFYIKVPDVNDTNRIGLFEFKDPIPARIHEGHLFGKQNHYTITPEEGMLIIFPAWVRHMVSPNYTNQDRISFSCNIKYPVIREINK